MEQIVQELKKNKLKVTPQRTTILKYLRSVTSHPNIEEIFENVKKKYPMMSKATVYNAVIALADKGLILTLNFDEGFVRFDANTEFHVHFYCEKCKKIHDIFLEKTKLIDLEYLTNQTKNKINDLSVYSKGICSNCLN